MPKFLKLSERLLGSKTITEPGVYNAIDDSLDGYSAVDVQIQPSSGDSAGLKFSQSDINTTQVEMDGMPACLFYANIPHGDVLTALDKIGVATVTIGGVPINAPLEAGFALDEMGGPEVPAYAAQLQIMETNPAMMAIIYIAFGVSWQTFDPFAGNAAYTEDPSVVSICGYCAGMDLSTGEFLNPAPVFDAFEVGPHTAESAKLAVMDSVRKGIAPTGYAALFSDRYHLGNFLGAGLVFDEPVSITTTSVGYGTFLHAQFIQGFTSTVPIIPSESTFESAYFMETPTLSVSGSLSERAFYSCNAASTKFDYDGLYLGRDCLTNAYIHSINDDEEGVYRFGRSYSDFTLDNTGFGSAQKVYILGQSIHFNDRLIKLNSYAGGVRELYLLGQVYNSNISYYFWFSGDPSSLEKLKAPNNILKNPGVSDLPSDLISGTPYNLRVLDVYDLIVEVADYNNFYNLETLVIRNDQSQTVLWAISDIINLTTNSPISQGSGFIYVPDNLVDTYKSALVDRDNLQAAIRPLSEYVEV